MPWNQYSDQRYEATREDVLRAVAPVPSRTDAGPDTPDPFGHNTRPYTDFLIALKITHHHGLWHPINSPAYALKLNRLRVLLSKMMADGSIVGRTRKEWAADGREMPSRARDILYAHPDLVKEWDSALNVPRETSEGP